MPRDVQRRDFPAQALITEVYDGAIDDLPLVFAGSRYDGYGTDSIDAFGRHTDYSYRDLNPGFFHIATANLLGLLNRPSSLTT